MYICISLFNAQQEYSSANNQKIVTTLVGRLSRTLQEAKEKGLNAKLGMREYDEAQALLDLHTLLKNKYQNDKRSGRQPENLYAQN
jgi:hypothetical protein